MDHHLLKDHVIQLIPSSHPKDLRSKSSDTRLSWGDVDLGYSCPKGTVPIRRTTKKDRIRAKSLLQSFQSGKNNYYPNRDVIEPPGQHVAVRHSYNTTDPPIPTPAGTFLGIQGEIKLDNPVVSPTMFGDNHTHISIYWRNGPDHGNCFNMYCEGFIQVSEDFSIGEVLPQISEYGGKQYGFVGLLFQDPDTRNWWFSITDSSKTYDIGYMPRELVPYLDPANYIAWGGLVKGPPNTPSPQMGNGHFPDGVFEKVSAIRDHMFVDLSHNLVTPQGINFENRFDNKDCYSVEEDSNTSIFFGGPGGNC
ncbi:hypothetical protein MKW92_027348 [Papaver armeniacum]|nr:hypothetical protein MKW92_027348 [Papaver armeniacum]